MFERYGENTLYRWILCLYDDRQSTADCGKQRTQDHLQEYDLRHGYRGAVKILISAA